MGSPELDQEDQQIENDQDFRSELQKIQMQEADAFKLYNQIFDEK